MCTPYVQLTTCCYKKTRVLILFNFTVKYTGTSLRAIPNGHQRFFAMLLTLHVCIRHDTLILNGFYFSSKGLNVFLLPFKPQGVSL